MLFFVFTWDGTCQYYYYYKARGGAATLVRKDYFLLLFPLLFLSSRADGQTGPGNKDGALKRTARRDADKLESSLTHVVNPLRLRELGTVPIQMVFGPCYANLGYSLHLDWGALAQGGAMCDSLNYATSFFYIDTECVVHVEAPYVSAVWIFCAGNTAGKHPSPHSISVSLALSACLASGGRRLRCDSIRNGRTSQKIR